jgi:rare lipoprotein A (peptidoglycan hydrolase)
MVMAVKSLQKTLFASALVAAVVAVPMAASAQSGIASVYSGGRTANGERASSGALTAAHKTLPFGTLVRVTNRSSGRSARALGFSGLANVTVDVIGRS